MHGNRIALTRDQIKEAIETSHGLFAAAAKLGVCRRTLCRNIKEYGLSSKTHRRLSKSFYLDDIVRRGKHPQYPTSKLLKRLVDAGYKEYKCESCGIVDYNGKAISLEVNHIDGNSTNHLLDNLEVLCPNCHSQTPTYRSKKLKHNRIGGTTVSVSGTALKAA